MAVPYTFANVLGGSSIPLSQLDDNFDYLTASPSFSGNVTITGTLGVGGAVTFSSTLNVTGITTLSNNLSVAGSSTFTGGATFSSSVTFDSKTITGTTGTGDFVLSVSPTVTSATLVAPALGTPTSGNLANCTNLPLSSVTGLGTGVENFLAAPSSSNLAAAVTGETGTGALVFGTNPVLNSPTINTPTINTATINTPTINTPTINTATINTSTLNTPTLTSPVLGTPTSGTLTNCTGLPLTTGITGVLPVANGGTGISSLTTGYIPFGGATTFSSDSNLFWDNTGKRLGVGTSTPVYKLDVAGSARITDLATIAGPLFVGPQDTSTAFQGMRLTNGADSSASQTVSSIDTTNNLGIPDSNIFFSHETNGSSYIAFSTTPAGARNTDRRVEKVVISPDGQTLVKRTPGVAGWGIVAKSQDLSTTIPNESGIYFDGLNNPEFSAYDSSGALKIRWQTANDTSNLVGGKPAFVCRAWVNFDTGVNPPVMRANGNVDSITDNGTGDYTINFLTSMVDKDYAWTASCGAGTTSAADGLIVNLYGLYGTYQTATSVRILVTDPSTGTATDAPYIGFSVFR